MFKVIGNGISSGSLKLLKNSNSINTRRFSHRQHNVVRNKYLSQQQQHRSFASALPDDMAKMSVGDQQQQQYQVFPSIIIGGTSQKLEPQGSFAEAQTQVRET